MNDKSILKRAVDFQQQDMDDLLKKDLWLIQNAGDGS